MANKKAYTISELEKQLKELKKSGFADRVRRELEREKDMADMYNAAYYIGYEPPPNWARDVRRNFEEKKRELEVQDVDFGD